jgi:hypothetical protein
MLSMGSLKIKSLFLLVATGFVLTSQLLLDSEVFAEQQYASRERATIARAHMSRARVLLVEALAEFEESKKYARPDMLIDSEDWRLRVISLTEQLNRVVDPRPRVTREGAVFRTPPRFIRREKDQLPEVADGAKSRSDIGERDRLNKKQQERARFFNESSEVSKSNSKQDLAKLPQAPELPAEPVLGASKSSDKGLFSNDLMPDLNATSKEDSEVVKDSETKGMDKNAVGKKNPSAIESDTDKLIAPADKLDDVSEPEIEIEKDLSKVDSKDKKIASQTSETKSEISKGNKPDSILPPNDVEVDDDEVDLKKTDVIGSESVPQKAVVEAGEELDPSEVAKQATEDEELAKRLEESISEKLSNRDAERN